MMEYKLNKNGEVWVPVAGVWVSEEELTEQADRLMTAPEPGQGLAVWDDNLFTTHCIGFSTSDTGETIDESNWATVVPVLTNTAENESKHYGDYDDSWAYGGYIRGFGGTNVLAVRVWVDDERTEMTDVFIESVAISKSLRDYCIFDEVDYSCRDWEYSLEVLGDDLSHMHNEGLDDIDDHNAIVSLLAYDEEVRDSWNDGAYAIDLEAKYRKARDWYYLNRAREQGFAQLEGQQDMNEMLGL